MASFVEGDFHTVEDVAKILDVSPMTVYRYIKAKRLTAYKIGKEYRVSKADFESFMETVKNT
jgi:putative molybdopterin biosynthesis protein